MERAEDGLMRSGPPGVVVATLLCFWLPGTLVQLTLRTRLFMDREALGLSELSFLDLFFGDVTFHAGVLCLLIGLLGGLNGRRRLWLLIYPVQIYCAFQVFLSLATSHFYRVTGTPLDFPLVYFGLSDLYNNWDLLHSEVSLWAAPLALGGAVALSWGASRLAARGSRQPIAPAEARLWCEIAAVLLIMSTMPFETPNLRLSRPPIWTLVSTNDSLSDFEHAREARERVQRLKDAGPEARLKLALRDEPITPLQPTPRAAPRQRNVVFFIYESTSFFDTTLHDPALQTTPTLASLARDRSIWAPLAYAVVPHTSKALVSIFCGVEPHLTLQISEADVPRELDCLPAMLGRLGWVSAAFETSTILFEDRFQLLENMGFGKRFSIDDIDKERWEKSNYFGMDDRSLLEPSLAWAIEQKRAGKPFMLSFLTLAPHHDYHLPSDIVIQDIDKDAHKNMHLNGVLYVDNILKEFLDGFKANGLYEDTIFVILGDHGEAFGEHQRFQHDNVIYEEGVRIPMMIHDPMLERAYQIDRRSSQLDLLPTLFALLELDITPGQLAGQDLRDPQPAPPIRTHCWFERSCMASVQDDIKYIHHFDNMPDQLFDLRADPHELHDLAATRAQQVAARRDDLLVWRAWVNYLWRLRFLRGRDALR
jgi:lipoteichoic acid synthase